MAVHSLLGYTLSVPDVEAGRRFYQDFGLLGREQGNRLGLRCEGGETDVVSLVPGYGRRLHHLTFAVSAADQATLRRQVEAKGGRLVDPPEGETSATFAVRDPDGNLVVVRSAAKANYLERRRAILEREGAKFRRHDGERGCPARDTVVRPWLHLGHI